MSKAEKRKWKQHLGKIMNDNNDWDQMTSADVELKIFIPVKKTKLGKAVGPSEGNTEMIIASLKC